MATKTELVGGAFQDSQGNLLANGYLKMRLSQDSEVNSSLICAGIEITIQLDANGDAVAGQFIWGNDVLLPVNSFYIVTGYTAKGQPAWGPNNQQVLSNSYGLFDMGTWIPNQVFVWTPPPQPVSLEVNGMPASSQTIQNFVDTSTVIFTDNGGGDISATAVIPTPTPAGIPVPDIARFALWMPRQAGGSTNPAWLITSDIEHGFDNGPALAVVAPTATAGLAVKVTTNPGNPGSYHSFAGEEVFYGSHNILFRSKGVGSDDYVNSLVWVGLVHDGHNANMEQTEAPILRSLLMFSRDKVHPNWLCITGDGTNNTIVSTAIPADTVNHTFEIDYMTGVQAVFKIDGAMVVGISITLPLNTDGMQVWASCANDATNTTASFAWEYLYAENVT